MNDNEPTILAITYFQQYLDEVTNNLTNSMTQILANSISSLYENITYQFSDYSNQIMISLAETIRNQLLFTDNYFNSLHESLKSIEYMIQNLSQIEVENNDIEEIIISEKTTNDIYNLLEQILAAINESNSIEPEPIPEKESKLNLKEALTILVLIAELFYNITGIISNLQDDQNPIEINNNINIVIDNSEELDKIINDLNESIELHLKEN